MLWVPRLQFLKQCLGLADEMVEDVIDDNQAIRAPWGLACRERPCPTSQSC